MADYYYLSSCKDAGTPRGVLRATVAADLFRYTREVYRSIQAIDASQCASKVGSSVFLPIVLQILQNYASHCAVYCNRGIIVNSILSVEKVRRFVCKHLRPM